MTSTASTLVTNDSDQLMYFIILFRGTFFTKPNRIRIRNTGSGYREHTTAVSFQSIQNFLGCLLGYTEE